MIRIFYDPGLVEKGRQEGRRLILLKQIKKRKKHFGAVSWDIEEKINALEVAQLEALAEKILEITTEEELQREIMVTY